MSGPGRARAQVRESFLTIEGEAPLIGTLARCEERGGTAVVLVNAGLIGRSGPDDLYTRLARRLAAEGYPTLRVDYSGVGDSPPRRDRTPLHEARVEETRSVMDGLRAALGVDRFVLMGICTGADNAFRTALADDRAAGLVLLDGYPYRTAGWWARHYLPRVFRLASWRTLLRRGVGPPRTPGARGGPEWDGLARLIPSRAEMARQLEDLIGRGTELYFLYTGGLPEWVNHAGQLRAAFRRVRFRGRVRSEYLPGADHVFRAAASQEALTEGVLGWLAERFPVR